MNQGGLKRLRMHRMLLIAATAAMALDGGRACRGSGHGSPTPAESHGGHGGTGHGEDGHSGVKSTGINLGTFKIRSDYPAEAQKSTVRFVLYATVKGDRFAEMEALAASHEQKIRDEIITATRLTPLRLFEEPDFAKFRRRIVMRLRRTLPELEIDQLYVSDFGLIVKSL